MATPKITARELGEKLSRHEISQIQQTLMDYHDTLLETSKQIGDKVSEVAMQWADYELTELGVASELGVDLNSLFLFHQYALNTWSQALRDSQVIANSELESSLSPYDIEYHFMFQLDGIAMRWNIAVPQPRNVEGLYDDSMYVYDDITTYWENKLDEYKKWVDNFIQDAYDEYDAHQESIINSKSQSE